jgi:hypothetical protein
VTEAIARGLESFSDSYILEWLDIDLMDRGVEKRQKSTDNDVNWLEHVCVMEDEGSIPCTHLEA